MADTPPFIDFKHLKIVTEMGTAMSMHGLIVHLVCGEAAAPANRPGPSTELLLLLPPAQAIEIGQKLIAAAAPDSANPSH